jgi:hypothetical protein
MKQEKLKKLIDRIKDIRVAIYGDFCIDAYWVLDSEGSDI